MGDVTVLIPARNEARVIQKTLRSLASQGAALNVVVVDDQSTDDTAEIARKTTTHSLLVISGQPLPAGWSGKLWALEQGRPLVKTPLTLLMDADIELRPGLVRTLRDKMATDDLQFVSLMVEPSMTGRWEKLLMPAFVYFFKLLYPFRLSNSPFPKVAAAAGGCILLKTRLLEEIGGFAALRGALIDDCTLARKVKSVGGKTWLGLTHSARSLRSYTRLGDLGDMVARTAFTQLKYSNGLLMLCTAVMVIGFWLPWLGLFYPSAEVKTTAVAALIAMMLSYMPTLKFYGRSPTWAFAMPLIGTFYLAMTWSSAIRYWRGERARWKDRAYTSRARDEP